MQRQPPRPRPRIIDKQRPEATTPKEKKGAKESDHNLNMGIPNKLRHGSNEAFTLLARKMAAGGGR
jgi:hypothetical protein